MGRAQQQLAGDRPPLERTCSDQSRPEPRTWSAPIAVAAWRFSLDDDRALPPGDADAGREDDVLALVLACCHPAPALDARVGLMPRTSPA